MHLMIFRSKKESGGETIAFLDVLGLESLGLPGLQMVVYDEHIRALEQAKVRFTYLSKTAANGKIKTPLQS